MFSTKASILLCVIVGVVASMVHGQRLDHFLHGQNTGQRQERHNLGHSDQERLHRNQDTMDNNGKDKSKTVTTAKLTATVMASDQHTDSYEHKHENSDEMAAADEHFRLRDAAHSHEAIAHNHDAGILEGDEQVAAMHPVGHRVASARVHGHDRDHVGHVGFGHDDLLDHHGPLHQRDDSFDDDNFGHMQGHLGHRHHIGLRHPLSEDDSISDDVPYGEDGVYPYLNGWEHGDYGEEQDTARIHGLPYTDGHPAHAVDHRRPDQLARHSPNGDFGDNHFGVEDQMAGTFTGHNSLGATHRGGHRRHRNHHGGNMRRHPHPPIHRNNLH